MDRTRREWASRQRSCSGPGTSTAGWRRPRKAWIAPPRTTRACSPPSSTAWRYRTLEQRGVHTRVLSAITVSEVAEPYIRRRAIRHLEKGRVVILREGTGNPFFTTTPPRRSARSRSAEAILMGKNGVDGVYDGDPDEKPDAEFIPEITHREALERGLKVMDSTALSLCMDNGLPIYVFGLDDQRNIERVVAGERVGTIISTPRRNG